MRCAEATQTQCCGSNVVVGELGMWLRFRNNYKVYHVRENDGAQHSVANNLVLSEAKSGATVARLNDSSTGV